MTNDTSISLDDHLANFIDKQLQSGRYDTASDVVRAGLRLLEEHEAKVTALQEALIAGEESGQPALFQNDVFLERMRSKNSV
ncbi:MAG: type II toxin-antitoxin system ParD family antitoxin [Roseomonas sp.]|nr:type II toxin-antitoxin system ParD family antitoxin [Roseomonas sp.]